MKRFYHVWVLVSFIIIFPASLCPAGESSPFAKILDYLAASYYEEQLQVAFGTSPMSIRSGDAVLSLACRTN